jgi:peptidoglycan/xylan/chitin deacetylase (PgdA/CDA1 family)
VLRKLAYRLGALDLVRHRQCHSLTVIMLHRVISPVDPDFAQADPVYTLSLPVFEQLLDFLLAHYSIVEVADVMAASDGRKPLPDHALLITFDDGWADNLRYAAPALHRRGMPAIIFAVAETILSPADEWWQETVFAAGRTGSLAQWLGQQFVGSRITSMRRDGATLGAFDVATALGLIEEKEREELLRTLPSLPCSRRMMMGPGDLPKVMELGIDIGLHGYNHVPLTEVADVTAELVRARAVIDAAAGGASTGYALGCPHGRYDDRVLDGARAAGIRLVFTSDPHLNATRRGMLTRDRALGRINVVARHIEDWPGRFDPSAAARWLWAREVQ